MAASRMAWPAWAFACAARLCRSHVSLAAARWSRSLLNAAMATACNDEPPAAAAGNGRKPPDRPGDLREGRRRRRLGWAAGLKRKRSSSSRIQSWPDRRKLGRRTCHYGHSLAAVGRDENGTDIFRPYSRPNLFKGIQISPYPSLNIQHPIPYPYPST